jgi:hypothetical protein
MSRFHIHFTFCVTSCYPYGTFSPLRVCRSLPYNTIHVLLPFQYATHTIMSPHHGSFELFLHHIHLLHVSLHPFATVPVNHIHISPLFICYLVRSIGSLCLIAALWHSYHHCCFTLPSAFTVHRSFYSSHGCYSYNGIRHYSPLAGPDHTKSQSHSHAWQVTSIIHIHNPYSMFWLNSHRSLCRVPYTPHRYLT